MTRRSVGRRLPAAAASAALAVVSGSLAGTLAATASAGDAVVVRRAFHEPAIERARAGAIRKLADPKCLGILDEFKDKSGRPLVESLARWDRSAASYMQELPVRDGAAHATCRAGASALFTDVGKPPVFVCPSFRGLAERDPITAESWLIHEMLHTLGLGENPPSSREITKRVKESCS